MPRSAIPSTTRHAVYVTCETRYGTLTFRVGQPVSLDRAHDRWQRIADRLDGFGVPQRPVRVRFDGKRFDVRRAMAEVRQVDAHGRGLGSERHALAFPVPYRALRMAVGS